MSALATAAPRAPRRPHWSAALRTLSACSEAVEWASTQPSLRAAWEACERADWMLWLAGRVATTKARRKLVVLASCACARTALRHVPMVESRPLRAIETTERWCRGEATLEDVMLARSAAAASAYASAYAAYASAYAAAASAYASASAAAASAYASAASAYASAAAAWAAYASYAAAYNDAAAYNAGIVARASTLKQCATLVRERIELEMLNDALNCS